MPVATSSTRFTEAAKQLGIEVEVRGFPEGTRTADDAARAVGVDVGQIVKSLVFLADGAPVLCLVSGANKLDTARLAAASGAGSVARATADEARAATGYAIGGVPPFGHAQELPVYCDRDLLQYEVVWAAAGAPTSVFAIEPGKLVAASGAIVADLKEE
jgi:Cys-tRNA(Pro) deacylase